MARLALLAVALFAAACCCARADEIGFSLQQQYNQTTISDLQCDTLQGFFSITVFNGFTEDRIFYAQGQTSGVGTPLNAVPTQLTIPARTAQTLFLYGPSTGAMGTRSIVGRQSLVQVFMVDFNANSAQLIGNQMPVCGGNFSSPCNCAWYQIPCMLDGCSPENYAFFWIVVDLTIALILSILGLVFMAHINNVFGGMIKHFRSQTSHVSSIDEVHYNRYQDMSLDQLRAERDALGQELGQQQYTEEIHRKEEDYDRSHRNSSAAYSDDGPVQEGTPMLPMYSHPSASASTSLYRRFAQHPPR